MASNIENKPSSDNEKPNLWQRLKKLFNADPKTTEDMVAIVEAASENEVIDEDAQRMIAGALEFSVMHTRDIMIPRTQMNVLRADESLQENLKKIIETSHSRYPVVGENIDEVLGKLLVKDLLPLLYSYDSKSQLLTDTDQSQKIIIDLLRPVVLVPESKRLNILLKQFREDRNHMALVIDEYGTLSGLVTIEDVLEEIVGEIEDEHDPTVDTQIRQISQSNFMVQALTPINTFNDFFNTNFSDEEFDTIGGIISNLFGRLPKRNETINTNNLTFHVTHADNRRLYSVRVTLESDSESTKPDPE